MDIEQTCSFAVCIELFHHPGQAPRDILPCFLPVIFNGNIQAIPVPFHSDLQPGILHLVFQSVLEGIFDQGLQDQLRHLQILAALRNVIEFHMETV